MDPYAYPGTDVLKNKLGITDAAKLLRVDSLRRADIVAAVGHGVSNGRVEAINNKVKVTVKMGYGFRNTDNLIALTMLRCSDMKPELPGRPPKPEKTTKKAA